MQAVTVPYKIKSFADSELKEYRQIFLLIGASLSSDSVLNPDDKAIVFEYGKKYIVSLLQFMAMEPRAASTTDMLESLSQFFSNLNLDDKSTEQLQLIKDFFTMGVTSTEGSVLASHLDILEGKVWNTSDRYLFDLTEFWNNRLEILLKERSYLYPEIAYELYKNARTDDGVGKLRFSDIVTEDESVANSSRYAFVDRLKRIYEYLFDEKTIRFQSFEGVVFHNGSGLSSNNGAIVKLYPNTTCSIVYGIRVKKFFDVKDVKDEEQVVPLISLNFVNAYAIDLGRKLTRYNNGKMNHFYVLRDNGAINISNSIVVSSPRDLQKEIELRNAQRPEFTVQFKCTIFLLAIFKFTIYEQNRY